MGSRIRDNVKHYFECFCEVVGPQSDGTEAWVIQKFPESYRDEEVLKSVPKFAFPCEFENTTVQHYSFVLTSHDSKWTFGFCRHDPKSETALVVLSFLPWHESFTKFLNVISELTHSAQSEDLGKFLESTYQSKVPDPGGSLRILIRQDAQDVSLTHSSRLDISETHATLGTISSGTLKTTIETCVMKYFVCQSPSQFQLPSIPENRNLTEYYNAVDCNNMMVIFASMLYERRIVFISRRLNRLSACVQSANAIIYPMSWQHIFIPVLPRQLVDYLLAPMPYLIGVSNTLINQVRRTDMGEVVILDADNNTVETPFQDLESLPQDVVRNLRSQLRNRAALLGDGVSRAFLRALVQLIGGYRDALRFHQGEKITFSEDAFVESRPPSMQPFLRKMLELQIFRQFIEERLDMLNAGLGFSDEFEMEACNYSDKSSSRLKQQYKEWLYTMRKDTSAFFKSVKSRVKERGKHVGKAYKGIRSKLRESTPRSGLATEDAGVSPPPVAARQRPHTTFITSATTSYRRDISIKQRLSAGPDSRNQYSPLSPSSPENSALNISPLDMDLMGDLQDVIFRNCSTPDDNTSSPLVDRTLKPVRSLESFPGEQSMMPTPHHNLSQTSAPDLFGASPFIAGAGDEGDAADNLQLIASKQVKLPPPKTQTKAQPKVEETNLIRLDSESSVDDFDPLLSKDSGNERPQYTRGLSLTNPLYPYFTPQHLAQDSRHRDLDLLKEYGLDFNSLSVQSTSTRSHDFNSARSLDFTSLNLTPATTTQTSQLNWTKFD